MKGTEDLLKTENRWVTDLGASFPREQRVVYRGQDLFKDLGDLRWLGLMMYGVTGRIFSENQLMLFESLWVLAVSYPDPRLWNNRVAALAATVRSTSSLGVVGASAVSESTLYGHRACIRAMDFFKRLHKKIDAGAELKIEVFNELKKYRNIFGYGRPIAKGDERIKPIMKLVRKLRYDNGYYLNLAFEVEKVLLPERPQLHMNAAAITAALCADQGLSTREFSYYLLPCFLAGIVPCYADALKKPEGTFLPLRCSRIKYRGKSIRYWD